MIHDEKLENLNIYYLTCLDFRDGYRGNLLRFSENRLRDGLSGHTIPGLNSWIRELLYI